MIELWVWFSVLTAVLLAANHSLDRVVMKDIPDAIVVSAIQFGITVLALALVAFGAGLAWPSPDVGLWVALRGALLAGFGYAFLKAARLAELTLNGVLSRLRLAFVLLFAAVFLGEALSPVKIASFALVVAGALVATSQRGLPLRRALRQPAFWYFVVAAVLYAAGSVVDKALIARVQPVTYLVAVNAVSIFALMLFISHPARRVRTVLAAKPWAFGVRAIILPAVQLAQLFAFQTGEASRVALVTELAFPLTFLVGILLLNERTNLPRRAFGSLLVIAASLLAALA